MSWPEARTDGVGDQEGWNKLRLYKSISNLSPTTKNDLLGVVFSKYESKMGDIRDAVLARAGTMIPAVLQDIQEAVRQNVSNVAQWKRESVASEKDDVLTVECPYCSVQRQGKGAHNNMLTHVKTKHPEKAESYRNLKGHQKRHARTHRRKKVPNAQHSPTNNNQNETTKDPEGIHKRRKV